MAGDHGGVEGVDKYPLKHSEILRGEITKSLGVELHIEMVSKQ